MNQSGKSKFVEIAKISIIILVMILILACPVTIFIAFMKLENGVAATYSEASLLATGIAIIGVAITVWTGLNIANSINRRELEELKLDSERIKKSVEVSFNNYNMFFLQELLKTSKDIISMYFYDKFRRYFDKLQNRNEDVLSLMEIEHIFVEIYSLYISGTVQHKLLIAKANDGLKKIEDYVSSKQPEGLVKQYLDYRIAEFKYYKGYNEKKPKDVYECFMGAINICTNFAKQIDIPLEYYEDKRDNPPDYNGILVEMACYLAGAIGNSYSRVVNVCGKEAEFETKKNMEDYANKAVYFCGCAAKWSKNTPYEREVYFRNLGCAYEGLDKVNNQLFVNKNKIMDNYKYAFIKMHNDGALMEIRKQKIYHTILSYFEKCFKEEFSKLDGGCLKYTKEERDSVLHDDNVEELSDYRNAMGKMFSKIKEKGNAVIDIEQLRDYVMIARSGVEHNPHYTLRISLLGLSYTYVIFLLKAGNEMAKQKFSKPLE